MNLEISYFPQSKLHSVIPKVGSKDIVSWACKNMKGSFRAFVDPGWPHLFSLLSLGIIEIILGVGDTM